MTKENDPTRLTALAHVGRIILVIGGLLLASILLNVMEIEFRALAWLNELPVRPLTVKLAVGLPCLVGGWILFCREGGREAVAAQKRRLREREQP